MHGFITDVNQLAVAERELEDAGRARRLSEEQRAEAVAAAVAAVADAEAAAATEVEQTRLEEAVVAAAEKLAQKLPKLSRAEKKAAALALHTAEEELATHAPALNPDVIDPAAACAGAWQTLEAAKERLVDPKALARKERKQAASELATAQNVGKSQSCMVSKSPMIWKQVS